MYKYRKLTDKIYHCLADHNTCKYQVPLGKIFCSWLMRREDGHTKDNFPCTAEGSEKGKD